MPSHFDILKQLRNEQINNSNSSSSYAYSQDIIKEETLPQIQTSELILALSAVPFSYILTILSLLVSAVIGGGIIWLIYYLEATFIHRVHIGIIVSIAIGIIVSVLVSLKSIIVSFIDSGIFEISSLATNEQAEIINDVEEVCKKLNINMPDNILFSFEPTFYVTESAVKSLDNTYKKRTLMIGLPYLRYLTKCEFKSVIAHEMAHFTGKDTLFSLYVYPVYKNLSRIIQNLNGYQKSEWIFLSMIPVIIILSIFYNSFSKLESKISREREKRADFIAVILYGSENFETALTKISIISKCFYANYEKDFLSIVKEDKYFKNYFNLFDSYLKDINILDKNLISAKSANEFDTHFSISERFEYIPKINNPQINNDLYEKVTLESLENMLSEITSSYFYALISASKKNE